MYFVTANHTDVGIKKTTNQDSMLIEQAQTDCGNVLFAAVCDGMGGLAKGEVASATLVRRLSEWFNKELPGLLYGGLQPDRLRASWEKIINEINHRIADYGERLGVGLGTTCVTFLAVESAYYIMNVGDSRAYMLSDNLYQLTKDQTYCQREIDLGRMTPEQAAVDSQRSVLLQCVGASAVVEPDFFAGMLEEGQCYLLCSDGFVHVLTSNEIFERFNPTAAVNSDVMKQNLVYLIDLNKSRGETDNISAILIKTV